MEKVVRVYVWMKVVSAKGDVVSAKDQSKAQFLVPWQSDGILNRITIPHHDGASGTGKGTASMHMTAGISALFESANFSHEPMGFFFHPMPRDTTLEKAHEWITTDGAAWTAGASAWILMYSVATVSTF